MGVFSSGLLVRGGHSNPWHAFSESPFKECQKNCAHFSRLGGAGGGKMQHALHWAPFLKEPRQGGANLAMQHNTLAAGSHSIRSE